MEHYFIGKHNLGTFPDILFVVEHEKENYDMPDTIFSIRTYSQIKRAEFLKLADGSLEIRRVKQYYFI